METNNVIYGHVILLAVCCKKYNFLYGIFAEKEKKKAQIYCTNGTNKKHEFSLIVLR